MKKYTQPTVEITAFDFEDITMSVGGGSDPVTPPVTNMSGDNAAGNLSAFTADANAAGFNVVEW